MQGQLHLTKDGEMRVCGEVADPAESGGGTRRKIRSDHMSVGVGPE